MKDDDAITERCLLHDLECMAPRCRWLGLKWIKQISLTGHIKLASSSYANLNCKEHFKCPCLVMCVRGRLWRWCVVKMDLDQCVLCKGLTFLRCVSLMGCLEGRQVKYGSRHHLSRWLVNIVKRSGCYRESYENVTLWHLIEHYWILLSQRQQIMCQDFINIGMPYVGLFVSQKS